MNRSKRNTPATAPLKDREHGLTPKNARSGKRPLVTPEPEPVRPRNPLTDYDPFRPMTNYREGY